MNKKLLGVEIPSKRHNNLTKEERDALYSLRYYPSVFIKSADKGSVVVVWDREYYLKEAYKQLGDGEVCEEVQNDPHVLVNTIMETLEKMHLRGDLSSDTLNYFLVNDPRIPRFYLLPKIHKRVHSVMVEQTTDFTLKIYLLF